MVNRYNIWLISENKYPMFTGTGQKPEAFDTLKGYSFPEIALIFALR